MPWVRYWGLVLSVYISWYFYLYSCVFCKMQMEEILGDTGEGCIKQECASELGHIANALSSHCIAFRYKIEHNSNLCSYHWENFGGNQMWIWKQIMNRSWIKKYYFSLGTCASFRLPLHCYLSLSLALSLPILLLSPLWKGTPQCRRPFLSYPAKLLLTRQV